MIMLLNHLESEMLSQHKDQVMGWMSMVSRIFSWQGKDFSLFWIIQNNHGTYPEPFAVDNKDFL